MIIGFVANKFYHKYRRPQLFVHSLHVILNMPSFRQIFALLSCQSVAIGVSSTSFSIGNETSGMYQYLTPRDTTVWMSDVIIAPETTTTTVLSTAPASASYSTQSSISTRHWKTMMTDFTTAFGLISISSSTTTSTSTSSSMSSSIIPSTTTLTIDVTSTPSTTSS